MKQDGLYQKYNVSRKNPHSDPSKDSADCRFFVLDFAHDPFAIPALEAYAEACKAKFPTLSDHLLAIVDVYK